MRHPGRSNSGLTKNLLRRAIGHQPGSRGAWPDVSGSAKRHGAFRCSVPTGCAGGCALAPNIYLNNDGALSRQVQTRHDDRRTTRVASGAATLCCCYTGLVAPKSEPNSTTSSLPPMTSTASSRCWIQLSRLPVCLPHRPWTRARTRRHPFSTTGHHSWH